MSETLPSSHWRRLDPWRRLGLENHPKTRRAFIIGVVILLALILRSCFWGSGKKKTAVPPVPVAVAPAQKGDMPVYLDGLGTVTPFYTVTVHTLVDGQLMQVAFREGQLVHKGDLLVQVDPRPFQAQLDQAEGQLLRDQALLANARLDLKRYKKLILTDAIPHQQLDTQAATVTQDEGIVKTDRANVEYDRLQLSYCRITAPIEGRVGLRLVDPGNLVHTTDINGLVVITMLQPITVIFTLPEDSLPPVLEKIHDQVPLSVEAYNRDKTQKLETGQLLTVDNEIDPNTGTLRLKAVFDNKAEILFPNQFVNARLLLETRHDQVIIPAVAVQRGSQGTFVFVVLPNGTADMRVVKVGVTEGNNVSIDSGVSAGENVVIDGADKLQPGTPVVVPPPSDSTQGGGPPKKGTKASVA